MRSSDRMNSQFSDKNNVTDHQINGTHISQVVNRRV